MEINYKSKKYKFPDFIIVGAAKSGTTSLFYELEKHKSIHFSEVKEPNFFNYHNKSQTPYIKKGQNVKNHFVNTLSEYSRLFNKSGTNQILGEATTYYLYHYKDTIKSLNDFYGDLTSKLKIIIVLRNPIKRVWSQYMMKIRDGQENLPFLQAIEPGVIKSRLNDNLVPTYDYIGFGMYYDQVKAYLARFPKCQILLQEDLSGREIMDDVYKFLDIGSNNSSEGDKIGRYNASGLPKNKIYKILTDFIFKENRFKIILKRLLPISVRKKIKSRSGQLFLEPTQIPEREVLVLKDIYKEDIQKLSKLINRDLSHWYE